MEFQPAFQSGRFVRRYKRFFADILTDEGTTVVAHCPNPGSMRSCLLEGARVWMTTHDDPRRKLRFTWQILEAEEGRVMVNPTLANDLVAEALALGQIAELQGYPTVRREVAFGEASRVDFVLQDADTRCFVEVKNVTLALGEGRTAFPDAVTERGARHLRELIAVRRAGHRAVLLFCAAREGASSVQPADDIDPEYGTALRDAAAEGVELLAYRCSFTSGGVTLSTRIPVVLPEFAREARLPRRVQRQLTPRAK